MEEFQKQYKSLRQAVKCEYNIAKLKLLLQRCEHLRALIQAESLVELDKKLLIVQQIICRHINVGKKRITKAREKSKYPHNKPIKGQEYKDPLTTLHNSPTTTSKSIYTYRGGHPRY